MSFCTMPIRPVQNAVVAPMNSTKYSAVCDSSNSGDMRATIKMPAVTIVAAWISAEIGVGPSIESGSQTCSGTCADLPIAPMNRQMQMKVINDQPPIDDSQPPACASAGHAFCICAAASAGSPARANTVP